jgi:hypothetical protein
MLTVPGLLATRTLTFTKNRTLSNIEEVLLSTDIQSSKVTINDNPKISKLKIENENGKSKEFRVERIKGE